MFVISDLEAGGAQRVAVLLLDHWRSQGHTADLVTVAGPGTDFFETPAGVRRFTLQQPSRSGVRAVLLNNIGRLRGLRGLVHERGPDVVVSFMDTTNVLALMATATSDLPVVVSERNDPRQQPLSWQWRVLRRLLYRRAAVVVVQTESVRRWGARWLPPDKVVVIPNPVELPDLPSPTPPQDGTGAPFLLAIGRLTHQKGFDVLVRAFAGLAEQHPEWRLLIAGDGPDRVPLADLVSECGLDGRVELLGRVPAVGDLLGAASAFVLSSRYEGFPNVLLEAMAHQLPAVATRCPSGPDEIVTDGVDGLLVPPDDVAAMDAALNRLMGDARLRRELGAAARQTVAERFRVDAVGRTWDELIRKGARCGS